MLLKTLPLILATLLVYFKMVFGETQVESQMKSFQRSVKEVADGERALDSIVNSPDLQVLFSYPGAPYVCRALYNSKDLLGNTLVQDLLINIPLWKNMEYQVRCITHIPFQDQTKDATDFMCFLHEFLPILSPQNLVIALQIMELIPVDARNRMSLRVPQLFEYNDEKSLNLQVCLHLFLKSLQVTSLELRLRTNHPLKYLEANPNWEPTEQCPHFNYITSDRLEGFLSSFQQNIRDAEELSSSVSLSDISIYPESDREAQGPFLTLQVHPHKVEGLSANANGYTMAFGIAIKDEKTGVILRPTGAAHMTPEGEAVVYHEDGAMVAIRRENVDKDHLIYVNQPKNPKFSPAKKSLKATSVATMPGDIIFIILPTSACKGRDVETTTILDILETNDPLAKQVENVGIYSGGCVVVSAISVNMNIKFDQTEAIDKRNMVLTSVGEVLAFLIATYQQSVGEQPGFEYLQPNSEALTSFLRLTGKYLSKTSLAQAKKDVLEFIQTLTNESNIINFQKLMRKGDFKELLALVDGIRDWYRHLRSYDDDQISDILTDRLELH